MRLRLAGGNCAVMTTETGSLHLRMIHGPDWRIPKRSRMAGHTIRRCLDVIW